LAHGVALVRI